jgi:hypothetical protein
LPYLLVSLQGSIYFDRIQRLSGAGSFTTFYISFGYDYLLSQNLPQTFRVISSTTKRWMSIAIGKKPMLLQILFNEKFDEKFTQELINKVTEKE